MLAQAQETFLQEEFPEPGVIVYDPMHLLETLGIVFDLVEGFLRR
jgi:hypothetical protein